MKRIIYCIFFLSFATHAFEKTTYTFSKDPIDVVIPCHKKDARSIESAVRGVKKNVQGVRRVIVVSSEQLTSEAEWIDEKIFPFTKENLAQEIFGSSQEAARQVTKESSRMGWIYQQFLKLYAPLCIPDISKNVLIVDADVVFLKPITFVQEDGAGLYAVGSEFNIPYFDHASRILLNLKRIDEELSGVVHHMLFQQEVLLDLFSLIEKQHGTAPWKAIARMIPLDNKNDMAFSAMSEYEIYFNFAFARTDQVKIRKCNWANTVVTEAEPLEAYRKKGFDYVAIHVWEGM